LSCHAGRPRQVQPYSGRSRLVSLPAGQGGGPGRHRRRCVARPPRGKLGGVRMVKDGFAFEDGTPVKFWGVNLSYTANAPDKETADFTAARFARYGINAVRMHKFSYPTGQMGIGDPNDSTRMDPKGLDRLDYFVSKLKEHGVYFGW